MRNPVGPLPSTIYWRRRAVLLSVLALLTLLVVWVVASGGGGGNNGTDGANGKDPVQTITPGPSGSGPAISQAPGGRDESGSTDTGGSDSDSGSGSGSAGSGESGGDDGSTGSAGSGGGSGSAGSGGAGTDDGANGSVGSGDTLPAGSALPNCTADAVQLSLRSVQNAYAPDETPTFQLVADNSSGNDCKIDLGVESAVVTITQASSDDEFWSSDDCPKDAAGLLFRVSAGGSITYTFEWDREASAPECATPKAGAAEAGTYLVEAQAPGFTKAQTSFVLEKD